MKFAHQELVFWSICYILALSFPVSSKNGSMGSWNSNTRSFIDTLLFGAYST
jgi:hypothetical protein